MKKVNCPSWLLDPVIELKKKKSRSLKTWKNNDKNIDRGTNLDGDSIDHCFVSQELIKKIKKTYIDKTPKGSDHYPLCVEI